MASTYSDLKIELIGTGEQSGTWGITTNTNLGTALEEAIVGLANANFASNADLTLTLSDSNATQVARHFVLNVTSGVSLTTTRNLIVPAIEKPYLIANNTTGGQSIIVKNSTGTGVTVPNGAETFVYNNGTNVVSAIDYLPALTLGTALPIASGGTGATTDSGARTALGLGALATQGDGDKGDITVSSSGASWTIDNQAVTFAKVQNVATERLAGRTSPGAGSLEEISVGTGLSLTGGTLSATASGGGDYVMRSYSSPDTWSKPTGLKAVKVTVVSAGGGGGGKTSPVNGACTGGGSGTVSINYFPAPTIPGPVTVTVGAGGTGGTGANGGTGGTSSFGPFISATGGAGGVVLVPTNTSDGGVGGAAVNNIYGPNVGGTGGKARSANPNVREYGSGAGIKINGNFSIVNQETVQGAVGSSIIFDSIGGSSGEGPLVPAPSRNGIGIGAGAGGAGGGAPIGAQTGGTGAPGIVIVEEFY